VLPVICYRSNQVSRIGKVRVILGEPLNGDTGVPAIREAMRRLVPN